MLKLTCTSTMSLARLCTVVNTFLWRSPRLVGGCTIQFHYFCFLRQPKGLPLLVREWNTCNLRPVKGSVSCGSGMGDVSFTTLVRCTLVDRLLSSVLLPPWQWLFVFLIRPGLPLGQRSFILLLSLLHFNIFFSIGNVICFRAAGSTHPPPPRCRNRRNGKQERLRQGGICHPPGYGAIRPIFSLPRDSLALDAFRGRHETC